MNTEQERAELLPCPFCGGSVSFHQDDEECRDGCHYIECKTCGTFDLSTAADPTNTVEDLGELRARIAPLWNRRAALQQDREDAMEHEFELWQDDMPVARAIASNRDIALREIHHYAAQYSEDGPTEIFEVVRRRIEGDGE